MRLRPVLSALLALALALPQGGCLLVWLLTQTVDSEHSTDLYDIRDDLWSVHPEERVAAARKLGTLSRVSIEQMRYLSRLAYDDDATVKAEARRQLQRVAPQRIGWIQNHLEDDIDDQQTDGKSLWEAFAYSTVHGPIDRLLPAVRRIATEGNEMIRVGAILVLAANDKAPDGAVEVLRKSLRAQAEHSYPYGDGPEEALMALGFMGTDGAGAIDVMEAYTKSGSASERWAAEWALRRVR